MIICRIGDPIVVEGWKRVVEIEPCAALPKGQLRPEQPEWSESLLERSLLRRPAVLANALGVRTPDNILALRQVARIDLYLRHSTGLHLLELKKPTEHANAKWQFAAKQIAGQWAAAAVWLRRGDESVHLWAVMPVRWSRSKGTAKIPQNWRATLAEIKREQLTGLAAAELGILFYAIVRSASGRFLLLWRADEPVPTIGT
jgi:hypothetical protein